ncbi:GNAT family N-acetyltransferase [Rhodococcus sp. DT1]|uniref:GNAT family N-acetyltransferase n=1 Tax=unclassified Rhodococcus (in: high G+C Gram-positive bacteria) TaxID=192944 RepID=UPI003BB64A07
MSAESTVMKFRSATQRAFDDVTEMLGPKRRPDALACWCLTYRLGAEAAGLDAGERRERVFEMCAHRPAPGILAYLDGEVVGWAGVAPRSRVAALQDTETYPLVDGVDPWSIFCLRTKGRRRRRGIGQQLLLGAIAFAREHGAEVVEGYPLDTGDKVDAVFTYPGLRSMFEKAGFVEVAPVRGTLGGAPRVVMRLATPRTRR